MEFVAYDLETTGINPDTDHVVEIGAVKFRDEEPIGSFCMLINPGCPIPIGASQVNGISDEMVRGQPPIQDVLSPFADFCGDLVLVAHNARFDFKFLYNAVKRHKAKAPTGPSLDTFALAKRVVPGLPNYRLDTLTRFYNLPSTRFHRAEEDAEYCGMIFNRILRALESGGHPTNLDALHELMGMKEMRLPQVYSPVQQLGLF